MISKKDASRISSLIASYDACDHIQNEWDKKAKQHAEGSREFNSFSSLAYDTWHDRLVNELALLEEFGISIYHQDSIEARIEEVKRLIVIAREASDRYSRFANQAA